MSFTCVTIRIEQTNRFFDGLVHERRNPDALANTSKCGKVEKTLPAKYAHDRVLFVILMWYWYF